METLKMALVTVAIIGTVLCNIKNAGADGLVGRSGHGWDDFAVEVAQTVICEDHEGLGTPCENPRISASVYENGDTVRITVRIPTSYAEHARAIERVYRTVFRSYAPRGTRLEFTVWVLSQPRA